MHCFAQSKGCLDDYASLRATNHLDMSLSWQAIVAGLVIRLRQNYAPRGGGERCRKGEEWFAELRTRREVDSIPVIT